MAADFDELRERLVAMRAGLLDQLAERLDAGSLALLAGVLTGLAALDQPPAEATMTRAVVSDVPGGPIMLALYGDDGRSEVVELSPVRAIVLAGRLIETASRRIA
jgi:hypothetical protein